jgi:hypothetical protein
MKPRDGFRGTVVGVLIGIGMAAIGGTVFSGFAVQAETPAGAILVVDGAIAGGGAAGFDLARLKSLPATEVITMTPWTDGESRFEGVRIRDLLEALGGRGERLIADAVDDYQVRIPMEDVRDYDVIIAYAMDGMPLPEDNKGPLWIIYPYSQHAGLQKDLYFSRSVWQLNRLTVQ